MKAVHWTRRAASMGLGLGVLWFLGCSTTPTPNTNSNANTNTNSNTPPPAPEGRTILTFAGTGIAGQNGDGLAPTETYLYLPQDVTVSDDGTVYILDWNNHRIRRITNEQCETVVGTGELGPADDGVATEQKFNHPTNVAFDHEGRMIIAAWHNSKVKRVDLSTGLATNLAGTGARAFGGDEGPGNEAMLDLPSSVAVDANDNILISDQANYRIRLLEPNGTIHTVVGTGEAGFAGDGGHALEAQLNAPKGQAAAPGARIDLDANDRIVIADTSNHRVRLVDNDGTIRTIAGDGTPGYAGDGGQATQAQLDTPSDVSVGPDGSIYIADTMNHAIRKVDLDGVITTFAGTGERGFSGDGGDPEQAKLDRPYGVFAATNGDVYIADTHNQRIRIVVAGSDFPTPEPPGDIEVVIVPCTDEPGSICTYAGVGVEAFNGDGLDRLRTALYWPFDIEFTPSGRTYVLDWNNHKVREILANGTFRTVMGGDFVGDGPPDLSDLTSPGAVGTTVQLNHPTDLFELPDGDLGVVAWHNHKLRILDPATGLVTVAMGRNADFQGDGAAAKDGRLNQPAHAVLDKAGNLFIIDQRNQRIRVIRNFAENRGDGIITTVLGIGPPPGFNGDGLPLLETQVNWPTGGNPEPTGGIAMDDAGTIYFSDTNNHRIRRVRFLDSEFLTGEVTTIAGTGEAGFSGDGGPATAAQINYPEDLEIGPDGDLYFADTNNHRVRAVDLTDMTIRTVAGNGQKGYGGDGGPAAGAMLNRPFGVAFDAAGDLYVSDTFNGRIRKVKL